MPGKLTARDRAQALSEALGCFPNAIADGSMDALTRWIECELGHEEIIDRFVERGALRSKAIAPQTILHILAGNTPNAAIQSITMGVMLGSKNLVKVPSKAPAVSQSVDGFLSKLPLELRSLIEVDSELCEQWLSRASAVIVYGSDETVSKIRNLVRPGQKLIAHGHKLSLGVVFQKGDVEEAATLAAEDVSLFDQQGCLSPHDIYVEEAEPGDARVFAKKLAASMACFNDRMPRGKLSLGETRDIQALRSSYGFRAASDHRVAVWESEGTTDWTVIYEEDPQFAMSCLNRLVFVKPLPSLATFPEHLRLVRAHLSSVAIWPWSEADGEALSSLGASRICALGQSQKPSAFWHADGISPLQQLVEWIDLG